MDGKVVIISAPSGAGKTTIVRHLLACGLGLEFSVSAATRQKRENETDGVDYFFMSADEFRKMITNGELAEWQEVYKDSFYGTPKKEIERIWSAGKTVLFDVDVMGGINLKKMFGKEAVSIFIMPPSVAELEKRLRARGTDSEEKIRTRIQKAEQEIMTAGQFDYTVINDDLEKARKETEKLVKNFLNIQ
ncbi:MAG: guanylate kinase [Bacteroidales bacterium]